MLTEVTESLKFLVAFRPGLISPTLAAQMAATFQRHSQGRLLLNVVVGGEPHEQKAYGDFLSKDERYERCHEFLEIVKSLWTSGPVNYAGKHFRVEEASIPQKPDPLPPLYFGGSSAAAGPVAAKHSDVYLTWGEPVKQVAEKVAWIRGLADEEGRTVRFGIRLHVISRDSSAAAWAEADRLLAAIDPETIKNVQTGLARSESVGQKRMIELHKGSKENLKVGPNLWAGVGLVRGGAGTALVGSHSELAARIKEYAEVGISEFVLSGVPHLEEAYWFGEGVLPILKKEGLWQHPHGEPAKSARVEIPFSPASTRPNITSYQVSEPQIAEASAS
jgi:alkanesulfonate monooxygenase